MNAEKRTEVKGWLGSTVLPAVIGGVASILVAWLAAPSFVDEAIGRMKVGADINLAQLKFVTEHPDTIIPANLIGADDLTQQKVRLIMLAADPDRERARRKANAYARLGLIPADWANIDAKTAPLSQTELLYLRWEAEEPGELPSNLGFQEPSAWELCQARLGVHTPPERPVDSSASKEGQQQNAQEVEDYKRWSAKLAPCKGLLASISEPVANSTGVLATVSAQPEKVHKHP